jgi:hypothetical protein
MPSMAEMNIQQLYGSFAIVAFALGVFNFLVSLWSIMNVRALKAKLAANSITSNDKDLDAALHKYGVKS